MYCFFPLQFALNKDFTYMSKVLNSEQCYIGWPSSSITISFYHKHIGRFQNLHNRNIGSELF